MTGPDPLRARAGPVVKLGVMSGAPRLKREQGLSYGVFVGRLGLVVARMPPVLLAHGFRIP